MNDQEMLRLNQFAVENLPDAVYWIREDSQIIYVNKAACDILGYSRDELLSMRITELNANMSAPRWDVVWAALRKNGTNTMEVMHRAKDGNLVPFEISATFLEFEGQELSNAHARDITGRRKLEERLRQTEKMEALGQLAGGVAHDFNNLLLSITGYADLLATELQGSPALLHYTDQIQSAAKRSADLTRQLLTFSRQGPVHTEVVDMHDVLNEVLSVLRRSLNHKVEIAARLDAETALVEGDPTQLMNAFLNLSLNARDAMPSGGKLSLSSDVIELDREACEQQGLRVEPGSFLSISVSDTGVGMSKALAGRVYEPFFTTKPKGEGTGLGLTAVYGTVMSHQGAITLYTEPGLGTVFRIYLPLSKSSDEVADAVRPAPIRFESSPHVLVIEDEAPVRQIATLLLESLGCRVTSFESSVEAVEFFRFDSSEFDLILLDMCMPLMDGTDTFRALREIDPEAKVLLASGYTLLGAAATLIAEGALDFLQKPYRRELLAEKLQAILQDEA